MERDDTQLLFQLINSLDEAEARLEEAYDTHDYESFSKAKKFMLQIQRKIAEVLG